MPTLTQPSVESQICTCFRNALIEKLDLDPSQVSIAVAKVFDKNYEGKPFYLVVPGAPRPSGPGQGAQQGGTLFRKMNVSVFQYGQSKLDQHSLSSSMLIDTTIGSLDQAEAIRQVFAYTFFGDADGSNCLLSQPLLVVSESAVVIEDPNTGVFSREFVFEAEYGLTMPSGVTLFRSQIQNPNP